MQQGYVRKILSNNRISLYKGRGSLKTPGFQGTTPLYLRYEI